MEAVDRVMTCTPGRIIMGMSAETFWDGLEGSIELEKQLKERAGVPVAMGSDACRAALVHGATVSFANHEKQLATSWSKARARCPMASFLSGSISPKLRSWPSATNIGS